MRPTSCHDILIYSYMYYISYIVQIESWGIPLTCSLIYCFTIACIIEIYIWCIIELESINEQAQSIHDRQVMEPSMKWPRPFITIVSALKFANSGCRRRVCKGQTQSFRLSTNAKRARFTRALVGTPTWRSNASDIYIISSCGIYWRFTTGSSERGLFTTGLNLQSSKIDAKWKRMSALVPLWFVNKQKIRTSPLPTIVKCWKFVQIYLSIVVAAMLWAKCMHLYECFPKQTFQGLTKPFPVYEMPLLTVSGFCRGSNPPKFDPRDA